jgi:3-oxoacyl-[acyl-carrier protein] reductase
LINTAAERIGPLDALVMSHCESVNSGVLDTSVEGFDRHYAVNVRASWLLIAGFARQLGPAGGAVIALTSDHTVGNLPYGATKGALDRLVLASAHELAGLGLRAKNLVRFLLSPRGAWINGQLLYSNGGYPKGYLPH